MSAKDHPLLPFFDPQSVAVIGASSDADKLGGRVIRFMLKAGYRGKIFPINRKAGNVQGLRCYASLADVPQQVDQAVIIVPASAAQEALQACIDHGIKHVQILSSGFAEEDDIGRQRQETLARMAREHGVRLIGPNCLGIVSVPNRYFATFSTALEALSPQPGGISFATQSGAFGSCAYAQAIQRGLGIARIVATGNEADVDVAQCIDFLASDPETRVICGAIEGCRSGDVLRRALLRASAAGKAVVLMKVGTSSRGQLAAATHTGAIAGNDRVFDTVVRECGAWRARTIEEMLDIAYLCTQLPGPRNSSAGILTVSGGIGVLMTDDAERHGIAIPGIPAPLQDQVHDLVPFAIGDNPLDTTAQISAIPGGIAGLARLMLAQTEWSTLCIYLAQIPCDERRFPPLLEDLGKLRAEYPDRLIVLVGPHSERMRVALEEQGMVIFSDPGRAIAALGAACAMAERRNCLHDTLRDKDTVRGIRQASGRALPALPDAPLDEFQAKQILARYGLPVLAERLCTCAEDAVLAAQEMGFPVVAKIVSPEIQHKTEIGGVMLNLADAGAVREAYATLQARARAHDEKATLSGVLISPMIEPGTETILGVHMDPLFGPMIMFGMGGISVELFEDVAFASAPLTERRAYQLIESIKGYKLLKGWRGQPALDTGSLVKALIGLSELACDWREVLVSIDVNPFVLKHDTAVCLDALIVTRKPPAALASRDTACMAASSC